MVCRRKNRTMYVTTLWINGSDRRYPGYRNIRNQSRRECRLASRASQRGGPKQRGSITPSALPSSDSVGVCCEGAQDGDAEVQRGYFGHAVPVYRCISERRIGGDGEAGLPVAEWGAARGRMRVYHLSKEPARSRGWLKGETTAAPPRYLSELRRLLRTMLVAGR
jgi:hypothetical protein